MTRSDISQVALLAICLLAVGCQGDDPILRLIAELADADVDVRQRAVEELTALNSERADAVLASAVTDSEPHIRQLALQALGERGAIAAAQLPGIVPALDDPDHSVRVAAALAVQRIDPSVERSQEVLIEALRAGQGLVFLEVAELGPRAEWAVPTLKRLLTHPETKIRHVAAFTLGQLGPVAAAAESALKRAARNDPEEAVRQRAAEALEAISAASAE